MDANSLLTEVIDTTYEIQTQSYRLFKILLDHDPANATANAAETAAIKTDLVAAVTRLETTFKDA